MERIANRRAVVLGAALIASLAAFVPLAQAQPPECFARRPTLVGTPGDDVLRGTPRTDVIVTFGGDDVVRGGHGSDRICGRGGADSLYGGRGTDKVRGGQGDDSLFGGAGDDFLDGGAGDDFLQGGLGDDEVVDGADSTLAGFIAAGDRQGIREWADPRSIEMLNSEVAALDDAQRSQLAEVVLDTNATGTDRERLVQAMRTALAQPVLGFYAEIWSYTTIELTGGGFFGTCNRVFLSPVAFSSLSERDVRDVLMHESFHSFNCVNGGPEGSLNEGSAIWIFKAVFPEDYPSEGRNWAEATYGTKLYYRDILGNPNLPLEAPGQPTDKLLDVYQFLSERDPSRLPWNSTERLVNCFERYFEQLHRDVPFFEVWLPAAEAATQRMLADDQCRPI